MPLRSALLRLQHNMFYALPLLPVALLSFYLKWEMMRLVGFTIVARTAGVDDFTWVEIMSFYIADFVSLCVVLPLTIALLYTLNPRIRLNHILVFLTCLTLILILYIQLKAVNIVGTFTSLWMVMAALEWGLADPSVISEYVSQIEIIKFSGLIGILLLSSIAIIWINRVHHRNIEAIFFKFLRHTTITIVILMMTVSLVAKTVYSSTNLTPINGSPFHKGVLTRSIQHLFNIGGENSNALLDTPFESLLHQYQQLVNHPTSRAPLAYFGASKDYDVLLFVLETAPLQTSDLQKFPTLQSLAHSSFTSDYHFTTYPFTSYALFSIFTSMYPNPAAHHKYLSNLKEQSRLPGFFLNLKKIGYQTRAFLPIPLTYNWDVKLFNHVGLEQQSVADETTHKADDWQTKYEQDKASLDQLKQHISNWIIHDQRYAAVFLPQVGHAPWHNFNEPGLSTQQRGERLVALQDQWLGELVALLKSKGRLDKTIIIITGDHGIRTKIEDPTFAGNMIDAYSFRVPLQIYVPGVLTENLILQHKSSHIDISPTINYLMGFNTMNDFSQGTLIWRPELQQRDLFYLARGYLGANGMADNRGYWSFNYMTKMNYHNQHQLTFGKEHALPYDCEDCSRLTEKLAQFTQIQMAWLHKAAMNRE